MDDFVDIIGYEGLYKINKKGDVYNVKRKIFMKKTKDNDDYYCIGLSKNKKRKTFKIHKLVGIQFLTNPNNYELIDHIDKNRQNNNICNLRWIDMSGNNRNVKKKRKYDLPRGVKFNKNKTRYKVEICINKKNTYLGTYNTIEEASKAYENKYNEVMSQY